MKKEIELNVLFENALRYKELYYDYYNKDEAKAEWYLDKYHALMEVIEQLELGYEYNRYLSSHGINPYGRRRA